MATGVVNGGGSLAGLESGGGSALLCFSSGPTAGSTTVGGHGTGASNGGVVSHATAQAQYLHAVMQQGSFPFSFQAAPQFGPGFSTSHQQVRNLPKAEFGFRLFRTETLRLFFKTRIWTLCLTRCFLDILGFGR